MVPLAVPTDLPHPQPALGSGDATEEGGKYKTGDFDLEAHIATLPPCPLEPLSKSRRSSSGSRPSVPRGEDGGGRGGTSTQPLVGSRKRKARRHAIHRWPAYSLARSLSLGMEDLPGVATIRDRSLSESDAGLSKKPRPSDPGVTPSLNPGVTPSLNPGVTPSLNPGVTPSSQAGSQGHLHTSPSTSVTFEPNPAPMEWTISEGKEELLPLIEKSWEEEGRRGVGVVCRQGEAGVGVVCRQGEAGVGGDPASQFPVKQEAGVGVCQASIPHPKSPCDLSGHAKCDAALPWKPGMEAKLPDADCKVSWTKFAAASATSLALAAARSAGDVDLPRPKLMLALSQAAGWTRAAESVEATESSAHRATVSLPAAGWGKERVVPGRGETRVGEGMAVEAALNMAITVEPGSGGTLGGGAREAGAVTGRQTEGAVVAGRGEASAEGYIVSSTPGTAVGAPRQASRVNAAPWDGNGSTHSPHRGQQERQDARASPCRLRAACGEGLRNTVPDSHTEVLRNTVPDSCAEEHWVSPDNSMVDPRGPREASAPGGATCVVQPEPLPLPRDSSQHALPATNLDLVAHPSRASPHMTSNLPNPPDLQGLSSPGVTVATSLVPMATAESSGGSPLCSQAMQGSPAKVGFVHS